MFAYVARQPIFDADKEVYAYELLFRDGERNCFPDIEPDEATSKLITDSHLAFGIDDITGGKVAFINFHQNTLLYRFPTSLDPKYTVVEIVETVNVDENLVKACRHIRKMGYEVALDDYDFAPHWDYFLSFTSIVKIEVGAYEDDKLVEIVTKLKEKHIKLVAERVETREQFEHYKSLGFDYFQGYFLAKPEIIRHKKLGGNKLVMLELLTETGKPSIDMDKITGIFERDPTLTFKLLRFINNPAFDKRNTISSLRHAINYMGHVELKKFIALLALANLSESEPSELMTLSLVRAKFCEMMSRMLNMSEDPPSGFLTGLLSLMDTITSQDMATIMSKIPIEDAVKNALCGEGGLLRDCLKMANAFEHADWRTVRELAQIRKLKQTMLHSFYLEAVKWANALQSTDMS